MIHNLQTILLFLFIPAIASGQGLLPLLGGQRAGTAAATFLKIEVGARAAAVGGAFVAMPGDATSLYWNPALAAQQRTNQISASHIEWPADIQYEFVGYIQRLSTNASLGICFASLHMADMEVTTEYHPHGTGEYFSYGDVLAGLTYSLKMTDRFSFGVTAKFLQEDLAGLKMNAWMVDLGTFYWTGYKSLRFAVSLVNFGPDMRPQGTYTKRVGRSDIEPSYEEFSPPTTFRIGSAMDVLNREAHVLTASLQINHPVDNSENAVFGIEYSYHDLLQLRGGYRVNLDEQGLTAGAGVHFALGKTAAHLDFAYSPMGRLGSTNQFTVGFEF